MADDTIRRVYEIDAKIAANAVSGIRDLQAYVKQLEDALKGNTDALKKNADALGAGGDKAQRFLQSLKQQFDTIGLTTKGLLQYRAAQEDVVAEAAPLIDAIDRETKAYEKLKDAKAFQQTKSAAATELVSTLSEKRDTLLGVDVKGDAELYQAALLGVLEPVKQLRAEITLLTTAQVEQQAAQRKITADTQAQIAAENQRIESGQRLIANLREQREVLGLTDEQKIQRQGNQFGVGDETARELALLRAKKDILAESTAVEDAARAKSDEALVAEQRRIASGERLIASLKERIIAIQNYGVAEDELLRKQALASGVKPEDINEQLANLKRVTAEKAVKADKAAEEARKEDEATAADLRHSAAIQTLIASIDARAAAARATLNYSDVGPQIPSSALDSVASLSAQGNTLGATASIAPHIEELKAAQAAASAATDAEREYQRTQEEATAAARNRAAAGEQLIAQMRNEIATTGLDAEQQRALRAETLNVKAAYDQLLPQLRAKQEQQRLVAEAERAEKQAATDAAAAIKNQKAALDAYNQSLRERIALQGKTTQEKELIKAGAFGRVTSETRTLIAQLDEVGHAGHRAGVGISAGVGRELIVLGHEAIQGNYKRLGASLLVLGEYSGQAGALFSVLGVSILGVGAAVLGSLALIAKGAFEQDKFNKSLQLTANFAGVTGDSFEAMAFSVTKSSGTTIGATKDILQALISTGRYGPETLHAVGLAAADLARITGKAGEDISKVFDGITKDTVAWAVKTNEQYHFLDLAIYAHIAQLQLQGKEEEAATVAAEALHKSLAKEAENLGTVARAWRSLKSSVSEYVDEIEKIGKTKSPVETARDEYLSAVQREGSLLRRFGVDPTKAERPGLTDDAYDVQHQRPEGGGFFGRIIGGSVPTGQLEAQKALTAEALERYRLELRAAGVTEQEVRDAAERAKIQEKGISALESFLTRELSFGLGDKAIAEKIKTKRDYEEIQAANAASSAPLPQSHDREAIRLRQAVPDPQILQENLDAIDRRYGDKEAKKIETAVQAHLRALREENAGLADQIKQYDELGYAVNKSNLAKLNEQLQDPASKLSGARPDEKADLRAEAARKDAEEEVLLGRKGLHALQERIGLIQEEAKAQSENTRETQYAAAAGKIALDLQRTGNAELIAARDKLLVKLKEAINLQADNRLRVELKAESAGIDDQVKKINEEISLIGLNTLEHRKAIEVLKLETIARKQLVANPLQKEEIDASLARNIDEITRALERSYDEFRKFDTGAKEAFAAYSEAATNAASFSKEVVSNSLRDIEDALFTFYKTGKFSLTKFLQDLADEFLRQTARMQIKKLLDEDSIKNNIDKALAFVRDAFFPGQANPLRIDTRGIGTTSSPNDQQATSLQNFRRGEIIEQNGGPSAATTAASISEQNSAITESTLAFSNLVATGVTPAGAALTTFTAAIDAAITSVGTMKLVLDSIGTGKGTVGGLLVPQAATAQTSSVVGAATSIKTVAGGSDTIAVFRKQAGEFLQKLDRSDLAAAERLQTEQDLATLLKQPEAKGFSLDQIKAGLPKLPTDTAKAADDAKTTESTKKLISATDDSAKAVAEFKDNSISPVGESLAGLGSSVESSQSTIDLLKTASAGTSTDFDVLGASLTGSSSSLDIATSSAYALSAALDAAAASAGTGGGSAGTGAVGAVAGLFAAEGGIVAPKHGLYAFDSGGMMTPYGMLKPEYDSTGGVTNRPRLAVFGEGRKPEAYIPLDDGQTIKVSVGADKRAYVPLSGGRKIPVSLDNKASALSYGGVMSYMEKDKHRMFAEGGVMRYFASGGTTSGDITNSDPLTHAPGAAFNLVPPPPQPVSSFADAVNAIHDMTKSLNRLVTLLEVEVAVSLVAGKGGASAIKTAGSALGSFIFGASKDTGGGEVGGVPQNLPGDIGKQTPEQARANTTLGKIFTKVGDLFSTDYTKQQAGGTFKNPTGDVSGAISVGRSTSTQRELDLSRSKDVQAGAADATTATGAPLPTTVSGLPSAAIAVASETADQTAAIAKSTDAVTSFTTEAVAPASSAFDVLTSSGTGSADGLDQAAASAISSAFAQDTTTAAAANLATTLETASFAASSGAGSGSGSGGIGGFLSGLFGGGGDGAAAAVAAAAATGGLMTSQGMLPLRTYAYGGITDKPQLALYGEGRQKEAYIPLPDGKTIPVMIKDVRGEIHAHVPLPDGRQLPVSLSGSGIEALRAGSTDKGRPGLFRGIDLGPTGLASLAPMPSGGPSGPVAPLFDSPRGAIAEIEAKRRVGTADLGKEDDGGAFANFVRKPSKSEQIYAPGLTGVDQLRKQFRSFAHGGVMTPFGELVPNHYSTGGITNRPQLALFGEGRKPEAYVPLADGKTIPVTVQSHGGQQRAYVPLPSGRAIPVSLKHDAFSRATTSSKTSSFALGGVMQSWGDNIPIQAYADGGIAGSVDPYASGAVADRSAATASRASSSGKRGAGDTFFVVENHGAQVSAPQETRRGDNDREIRYIINAAKAEAKAEMSSDIASGRGTVSTALRARGLDSTRTLQRKG